jgi:hypothetical protein
MDYFPRKSLSKYLLTDTIDFNKHVHDIDIFINDKWRKYAGGDIRATLKLQGDLNFALTNQKAKSTFTRRLLHLNHDCYIGLMESEEKILKHFFPIGFYVKNMSIYEILPALVLTQSVHAKISMECTGWSNLKFPEYP